MINDDLLFRHRLLLFAKAAEVGVSRACRELGYHRSWYYRWKPAVERKGLEMLRPRDRFGRSGRLCEFSAMEPVGNSATAT